MRAYLVEWCARREPLEDPDHVPLYFAPIFEGFVSDFSRIRRGFLFLYLFRLFLRLFKVLSRSLLVSPVCAPRDHLPFVFYLFSLDSHDLLLLFHFCRSGSGTRVFSYRRRGRFGSGVRPWRSSWRRLVHRVRLHCRHCRRPLRLSLSLLQILSPLSYALLTFPKTFPRGKIGEKLEKSEEKKIRRIERRRGESGQSTMALLRRKLVSSDADRCIQGTNDDASVSKM